MNDRARLPRIVAPLAKVKPASSARLLGELEAAQSANDLEDLLHGIGEELRHIEYHIRDMAYFDYVLPVADSDACPPPTDD